MPHIRFETPDGAVHDVSVAPNTTIKQAALDHLVPGILGECGGNLACGTCHGYVAEQFLDRLPPITGDEEFMLDGVAAPRTAASRLTCQLVMTGELDGIIIRLPETQV